MEGAFAGPDTTDAFVFHEQFLHRLAGGDINVSVLGSLQRGGTESPWINAGFRPPFGSAPLAFQGRFKLMQSGWIQGLVVRAKRWFVRTENNRALTAQIHLL